MKYEWKIWKTIGIPSIFVLCHYGSLTNTENKLGMIKNQNFNSDNIVPNSNLMDKNTLNKSSVDVQSIFLPTNLKRRCTLKKTLSSLTSESIDHMEITCNIIGKNSLDFLKFRRFTSNITANITFSLVIRCEEGGTILFPYPGRARLLEKLHISNCFLKEYYSEMRSGYVDNIPDHMKYFSLVDSTIIITQNEQNEKFHTVNLTEAFECGPLNAIEITRRNITSISVNPTALKTYKDGKEEELNIERSRPMYKRKCKYKNLMKLDKSHSKWLYRHQFANQLGQSVYPQMQFINLSYSGLKEIPVQFYDWNLFSRNMKYLDLSWNNISQFGSITCHGSNKNKSKIGTLDLRHNNIKVIKKRSLDLLFRHCDGLYIDIRNNPFRCDCEMKKVVEFLHNYKYNVTRSVSSDLFYELKCFTPIYMRGKVIHRLSIQDLGCEILKNVVLKLPMIILVVILLLLTVCGVIGLRYRKEITILVYTRLHIVLPCQQQKQLELKKYDAFIAYSEADLHWVIYTLAQMLENPESGQRFSLCLHHRDFVVGAAISDNIVKSVENSRHTLLVVSKNFLKSEWCLLEFKTALHQSLMEKKRHLIIILLEDIPTKEFEPELKRCMQTLTYVKADDRWFWDKLIYALSDWSKPQVYLKQRTKVNLK